MAVRALFWSVEDNFLLEDVNSSLATHVFCAFAKLNPANNTITPPTNVANFTSILRQKNPDVKTLLSICGAGTDGELVAKSMAEMAASPTSRAKFIRSCIEVARRFSFDGLDLVYQFPPTEDDMANFGHLLREWYKGITEDADKRSLPRLLLTAAVYYTNTTDKGVPYPAEALTTYLDWINVMSYDLWVPRK